MKWKDIPGYEGLYQASTGGQIRAVDGKTTSNVRFSKRHWKGRIMKGRGDRYATGSRVSLWKDGQEKEYLVARLVARTFLGEPRTGDTVNHKDGNRLNNCVDNLEWTSLGDNIRHGFETGLYSNQTKVTLVHNGEKREFRSMAEASRFLGRSNAYVSNCIKKGRAITSECGTIFVARVGDVV